MPSQGNPGSARHLVRAASWGFGVSLGVAVGAYLTAVGGAGAPGVDALFTSDILVLPAMAGGVTFLGVFGGSVLVGRLISRFRSSENHQGDRTKQDGSDDEVAG